MSVVLGWAIEKMLAWRSLHSPLRYGIVALLFALGLVIAYIEWRVLFIQQELWYEMRIRAIVH